jgi:hypothetical protein
MRGRPWTNADDRLAMTLPPEEAARRTGWGVQAVYIRRHKLRGGGVKCPWTEAEDRLISRMPPAVAAKYLGRSEWAIEQRRKRLGFHRANSPPLPPGEIDGKMIGASSAVTFGLPVR